MVIKVYNGDTAVEGLRWVRWGKDAAGEEVEKGEESRNVRWRHGMEKFSALLALCERNPLVTRRYAQKANNPCFYAFFDVNLNRL